MDKRYQVFVSSTFADLKDERKEVIQALMKMDCIPAGMEIFPALDEEQFQFIKRIIDDCDYYLLIIGGRYGSITEEGISYTEKEYDYAIEQGKKVVALLHSNPEELPAKNTEKDEETRKRLEEFREKVSTGRLVRFWDNKDQLAGTVVTSLLHTIKVYPAVGWIRADRGDTADLLAQLNDLRKKYEALEDQHNELLEISSVAVNQRYASGEDTILVHGICSYEDSGSKPFSQKISWNEILRTIGPPLFKSGLAENEVNQILALSLAIDAFGPLDFQRAIINQSFFLTVKFHLMALEVLEIYNPPSSENTFWLLTQRGKEEVIRLMAVKKK